MKYKYSIKIDESGFDSVEDMFQKLRKAGYNAIDSCGGEAVFDDPAEEKSYCDNFVRLAKQYDIELYQAHAPILINKPEETFLGKEYELRFRRRLERMARLGIRYAAVHGYVPEGLDFFRNAQTYDYKKLESHNREINLEFLSKFTPFLKQEGMMLCIENLFAYDIILRHHVLSTCGDPNETLYYIDQLGEDCFGACYDSGHLNLFGGDEYGYITAVGKHLKMTHFHESWGKDFHGMDWHHLPGDGDVDWGEVRRGLHDVGFTGTINAEIKPKPALRDLQLKYIADAFKILIEG